MNLLLWNANFAKTLRNEILIGFDWQTTYLLCLVDMFFNRQSVFLWVPTVLPFIQGLLKKNEKKLARSFYFTFRFIDYVLSLNSRSWWVELDTTLCDKVCQWLATDWYFSPGTPISSANKTDVVVNLTTIRSRPRRPLVILMIVSIRLSLK
jgi:hypothetical protein